MVKMYVPVGDGCLVFSGKSKDEVIRKIYSYILEHFPGWDDAGPTA